MTGLPQDTTTAQRLEIFKIYRSYEQHENDLLNQRTGWLVTFQSVLIATFGFSFQKYLEVAQRVFDPGQKATPGNMETIIYQYKLFLMILPLVGVMTCYGAYRSIKAAKDAQLALRSTYNKELRDSMWEQLRLPDLAGGGSKSAKDDGSKFAYFLPTFCAVLWIGVFFGVLLALPKLAI